jgi:hypothetical protein
MTASRRPNHRPPANRKETQMTSAANRKRFPPLEYIVLAAPLLWVVPALLHPVGDPYAGIADETGRWLFVHIAQLVLAPFLGALVWVLLTGLESIAARVARAALVVWLVFFSAFDAVAGIATGVLSRYANSLAGEEREGVVSAVDFLFDDSQLAGGGFSVLGNLGHGSWIVVAIAAAVALHQARAPRAAVIAMSLSVLFAAHSGIGAAIGLVAIFVAGRLILRWRSARTTPSRTAETGLESSGAQTA